MDIQRTHIASALETATPLKRDKWMPAALCANNENLISASSRKSAWKQIREQPAQVWNNIASEWLHVSCQDPSHKKTSRLLLVYVQLVHRSDIAECNFNKWVTAAVRPAWCWILLKWSHLTHETASSRRRFDHWFVWTCGLTVCVRLLSSAVLCGITGIPHLLFLTGVTVYLI